MQPQVTKLAVVLLSGGLDSTVVAVYAQRQDYEVTALTLDYGQRHRRELEAAAEVARRLGLAQRVVDLGFLRSVAWYSSLTSAERFAIPEGRSPEAMAKEIPITYVPLRNTIFLTVAAALLESDALHRIEAQGVPPQRLTASILLGPNAIDYSGYPDCRPEYYQAMAQALKLGSKLGAQYGIEIRLETPLINKSKADIVRLGLELGAPLAYTWSCYHGGPDLSRWSRALSGPCGRCDSCLLRAKGFAEAGRQDPLLVRLAGERRAPS